MSLSLEDLHARVQVMEEITKRLDRLVFGNGRPGLIEELRALRQTDMEKMDRLHFENGIRMDRIEKNQMKVAWLALGVYVAWGFFTGSGTLTLHKVLETFAKP